MYLLKQYTDKRGYTKSVYWLPRNVGDAERRSNNYYLKEIFCGI